MERLVARYHLRANLDDHPYSAEELAAAFRDSDVVVPTVTDRLTGDVLRQPGRRAGLLAHYGAGTDNIDLVAARDVGLRVSNTPDVLTDCTADLTMGLILMVLRRLGEGERELRRGAWTGWRPTHLMGQRVSGRTLGLIGVGRIGLAVASRAHRGFGMRVIGYTPSARDLDPVIRYPSIEAVLREADVVSLHCPATPATHHLINRERLGMMQPGAVLINTARGSVVDEAALAESLRSGQLGGAGLDVYQEEPGVHPGLLARENVVLLPHLGSATVETRVAMGDRVLVNIQAWVEGRPLPDLVP